MTPYQIELAVVGTTAVVSLFGLALAYKTFSDTLRRRRQARKLQEVSKARHQERIRQAVQGSSRSVRRDRDDKPLDVQLITDLALTGLDDEVDRRESMTRRVECVPAYSPAPVARESHYESRDSGCARGSDRGSDADYGTSSTSCSSPSE